MFGEIHARLAAGYLKFDHTILLTTGHVRNATEKNRRNHKRMPKLTLQNITYCLVFRPIVGFDKVHELRWNYNINTFQDGV